jgi:hypothetical protein
MCECVRFTYSEVFLIKDSLNSLSASQRARHFALGFRFLCYLKYIWGRVLKL